MTRILGPMLVALVLLSGCPFQSDHPLSEPGGVPLDMGLTGTWSGIELGSNDSLWLSVYPFNAHEYYIELHDDSNGVDRMRAYAFVLGGQQLLHVNELGSDDDPEGYIFARYTISDDDELVLRFIGDAIVPKTLRGEPKALIEFLSDHLNDSELDDRDTGITLHRVGQE